LDRDVDVGFELLLVLDVQRVQPNLDLKSHVIFLNDLFGENGHLSIEAAEATSCFSERRALFASLSTVRANF